MSRLRVMISSTFDDLCSEREAVDNAIRDFRFERFRSEMMGSLNRSAKEVCDEMARECDLYILIIGERYGRAMPSLGISVTEREFDVARNDDPGKVLVYVKDIPEETREKRALAFLQKATDFTKGYFRTAPFKSIAALEDRVKNDIAVWITDRLRAGRLSVSNVFSIPTPSGIARTAAIFLGIIAIGLLAVEAATRLAGIPPDLIPPSSRILSFLATDIKPILAASISTIITAVSSYAIALLLAACVWAITIYVVERRTRVVLSMLTVLGIILSVFLFFFGNLYFGIGKVSNMLSSMIPSMTVLFAAALAIVSKEKNYKRASYPESKRFLLHNMLLSPAICHSFITAYGIVVLREIIFYENPGIGFLFGSYKAHLHNEGAYAICIVAILIGFSSYILIRYCQSYFAWAFIVMPVLSRTYIERPKD